MARPLKKLRPLKRRAVAPSVPVQRVPASKMRSTMAWFPWPEELAALLGKISDEKLGRRAGISPETVARERRRRGIESFRPLRGPIEWTPEMISLIGTESDGVVGRELGLSRTTIRRKRELLGLPPYTPPPSSAVESAILWKQEDLALLGTMSDRAVAKELGISAGSVILKRQTLKIPPFKPPTRPLEWTEEMLALLGQVSDSQIAYLYGISEKTVGGKRMRLGIPGVVAAGAVVSTPELIELLPLPAIEIQRLTGLSQKTIRDLRRKHGIEMGRHWSPKLLARLGKEHDKSIARGLGVSESVVRKKRKSLGVQSFRRTRGTRRRVAVRRVPVKAKFRWPAKLVARLGKVPDGKIARLAGISKERVARERKRRGIEAFRPPIEPVEWSQKMIRRLGTASDAAVARKLRLHSSSVRYKRQLLGIPPFNPKRHPSSRSHNWTSQELALLGKRSDAEVAEKLGISKGTVAKTRTQLEIPSSRPRRRVYQWTEELLALLGKVTDRELARRSGFSVSSIQRKRYALGIRPGGRYGAVVPNPALVELLHEKSIEVRRRTGLSPTTIRVLRKKLGIERPRRWTPELVARLGSEPDRKIARELGIAETSVHKKRRRHGIPPFQAKRRWKPEELALVGTAPDAEIARKLGRTPEAVAHVRRMRRV
jgi:DNA-binding CsgD family transcriptional regulator